MNINETKKQIPVQYHWLLEKTIFSTDSLDTSNRNDKLHREMFNKCECCGYDILNSQAYQPNNTEEKFLINGYVHYYKKHQLALCDKCVDEKNGQSWE